MNTNLTGQVNRLQLAIFLLATNLSWWLIKQKNALTVSTVSRFLKLNFLEWTQIMLDVNNFEEKNNSIQCTIF